MSTHRIIPGDCIESMRTLPDASVHCCVTSPPYWGLRDYGHDGQIGLEATPEAYVARMVEVFREVRRVLRDDGTCWLNLGDSYHNLRTHKNGGAPTNTVHLGGARDGTECFNRENRNKRIFGLKEKDLVGIPWRVAFALQADGWWLRQDIIWHKPNPMPESVRDRCTKAHEYVFLLTKSERYYYDAQAVSEPAADPSGYKYKRGTYKAMQAAALAEGTAFDGPTRQHIGNTRVDGKCVKYAAGHGPNRNRRSVWTITTKPYSGAHFAVMPSDLVEPCIKAGTSEHGCCPACGKPWERLTSREKSFESGSGRSGNGIGGKQDLAASHTNSTPDIRLGPCVATKTLGWQQSCHCDCPTPDVVASTVLDPFAGSGTTLAVAAELGRSGIGCELNPEYIGLAERRIKDARASVALFEGTVA